MISNFTSLIGVTVLRKPNVIISSYASAFEIEFTIRFYNKACIVYPILSNVDVISRFIDSQSVAVFFIEMRFGDGWFREYNCWLRKAAAVSDGGPDRLGTECDEERSRVFVI